MADGLANEQAPSRDRVLVKLLEFKLRSLYHHGGVLRVRDFEASVRSHRDALRTNAQERDRVRGMGHVQLRTPEDHERYEAQTKRMREAAAILDRAALPTIAAFLQKVDVRGQEAGTLAQRMLDVVEEDLRDWGVRDAISF